MLAILIHCMEASVVALVAVLAYRIQYLTRRFYEAIELNEMNYDASVDNPVTVAIENNNKLKEKAEREEQSMIIKILKGRAAASSADYSGKIKALQRAQLFAGTQLVNIKRQFGDLNGGNLEWLRESCAFYLIGAFDYIANTQQCNSNNKEEVILIALSSSLNISKELAYQYHYKALRNVENVDTQDTVRSGQEAAKNWLSDEIVPNQLCLHNQLENWGVFA